ncbi:Uu.00g056080.m01.CDS01 [Anthostomella pinea]|uniref:Uu.00g056080.m01.CDS01 n=1 Tax=Anthostomella pinea TaxID=933095 RepID=A0AAI8YLX4_9PEZI|nr:Uu.00g056080.m01.CDS01 [Anthostomella pinea]
MVPPPSAQRLKLFRTLLEAGVSINDQALDDRTVLGQALDQLYDWAGQFGRGQHAYLHIRSSWSSLGEDRLAGEFDDFRRAFMELVRMLLAAGAESST